MNIKELKLIQDLEKNPKLNKQYLLFNQLLEELKKREIPTNIIEAINTIIDQINSFPGSHKDLIKLFKKAIAGLLETIEKELKLAPKNYYRNKWMGLGVAFGLPIGVVFGQSLDNMAFIGIGLPIGMAIGIAYGTGLDKKALEENRQLDLEYEL